FLIGSKIFRTNGPENSSILELPGRPASRLSQPWQHSTNFRSKYGNGSEQKCSQNGARIYSNMPQAAETPSYAKRSQRICATTEERAVIRIRSLSRPERSRQ